LMSDGRRLAGAHRVPRQQREIERRVFGGERNVTLQLEADHVAQLATDFGKSDRLDGDRGTRQAEGDGARAQLPLIELRAERCRWLIGVDSEDVAPGPRDSGGNQAITEEDDGEASPAQGHSLSD